MTVNGASGAAPLPAAVEAGEIGLDGRIVVGGQLEALDRQPPPGLGADRCPAGFGQHGLVVRRAADERHALVVLGRGADKRHAADVDVLDGLGQRDAWGRRPCLQRDTGCRRPGQCSPSRGPAARRGRPRCRAPAGRHGWRGAGSSRARRGFRASQCIAATSVTGRPLSRSSAGRAARSDERPAQLVQAAGKRHETSFIVDREDGAWHRGSVEEVGKDEDSVTDGMGSVNY